MKRSLKISLTGFLISTLLLCVLLFTQFGFHAGLWLTRMLLPGELSYQNARGLLIGPISAKHIVYTTRDSEIRINKLYFQWSPYALATGKLHIKKLIIDRITILHTSVANQPNSHGLNKINFHPFSIKIDEARIHLFNFNNEYSIPNFDIQNLHLTKKAIRGQAFLQITKPYPLTATLQLSGKPQAYQFNLLLKNHAIDWRLIGQGSASRLEFHSDKPKMLGGVFTVNTVIDWQSALSWKINANIEQLELKQIEKNWPQHISLSLNTQGSWLKSQLPIFTVEAKLISGSTQVMINGYHNQGWNLRWNINMPDLSQWLPSGAGQMLGSGGITGDTQTPNIFGNLKASNINLFGLEAAELNFTGDYDLSYRRVTHIKFDAKSLKTANFFLDNLSLSANGSPGSHQIQVLANLSNQFLGKTKIASNWDGSLRNGFWNYSIHQFNLSSQHLGHWQLNKTVNLSINSGAFNSDPFCFESAKGKFCFKGNWSATDPWGLELTFHHVNLTPFFEHWRRGLSIQGSADLTLNASGVGKNISLANAILNFNKARLRYNGANGLTLINIELATWDTAYKNNALQSRLNLKMPNRDYLVATLNIPKLSLGHFSPALDKINGSLDAQFNEVKLFNIFIPDIFNPSGRLLAHMKLSGTLRKPSLSGSANLINGKLAITDAKINLTNLNASVTSQGASLLYNLKAYSDRVPVLVSGKTDFAQTGWPTDLSIRANHLLVLNTIEYQIYASPDLQFTIRGKSAKLNGTVLIPEAKIAPLSFSSSSSLPDDTTIIGGNVEEDEPVIFESNVKLILGSQVKVRANGLSGDLQGSLDVTRQQHQTILANGQLSLNNGSFTTHGKTLKILDGSGVTYANTPLSNPSLNIKATRLISVNPGIGAQNFSANNITVGVQILGSLRSPQISLFSVPSSLSQADILSYLLFGTPSNSNGPGNVSVLLGAISNLNLDDSQTNGGAGSQISQSLGLVEFGVEQQTSLDALGTPLGANQSSFVVGRYVSPKIYVRYSRGLLVPVNILQVRYLFNKSWAVETDTSSLGSGADILYTIQR